jgi:hypothetical protein
MKKLGTPRRNGKKVLQGLDAALFQWRYSARPGGSGTGTGWRKGLKTKPASSQSKQSTSHTATSVPPRPDGTPDPAEGEANARKV